MGRPIEANRSGPRKKAVLSIRISWDVYDMIRAQAEEKHISITDVVTQAILKAISK